MIHSQVQKYGLISKTFYSVKSQHHPLKYILYNSMYTKSKANTLHSLELGIVVLWLGGTHGGLLCVDKAMFLNWGQVTPWVLIKLYT